MSGHADLIARANKVFDQLGVVRKSGDLGVNTTDDLATGDFMDRPQVDRLVDLTVGQSGWLAATSFRTVSQRKGQMPRIILNDVITQPSGQNVARNRGARFTTDHIEYDCKKYEAKFYITLEDIREAAASGTTDFEAVTQNAFGKAVGNDMARWALNGDEDLANPTTPYDLLMAHNNGWLKILRARANRYATRYGVAYARALFKRAIATMPQEYADDENLRWMIPRLLDLGWTDELITEGNGNALTERNLTTRVRTPIHGIPQLIVPQLRVDQGSNILRSPAAAGTPGTVTDASGTVKAVVSAFFGGYATGNAGRKLRLTYEDTGLYEDLVVFNEGGANYVQSTGTLGQSSISTTSADYTIDFADATSVVLTNPANLLFVLCDRVRAYRKFEEDEERWKFLLKYEADAEVFNEDAAVLIDGVVPPLFDSWGD